MPLWKNFVPTRAKQIYWRYAHQQKLSALFGETKRKYIAELEYWQRQFDLAEGQLPNDHYEAIMLAMADEESPRFLDGKIVADLGCGPAGSLNWATPAKARLGLDVLSNGYRRFGIRNHDMTYLVAEEACLPLPSDYVDVLYTMNAIDHVDDFSGICAEIIRVLAPGGRFIGSFNLHEPASVCEPQSLDEQQIDANLLGKLQQVSRRVAPRGPGQQRYKYFFEDPPADADGPPVLWLIARKPA